MFFCKESFPKFFTDDGQKCNFHVLLASDKDRLNNDKFHVFMQIQKLSERRLPDDGKKCKADVMINSIFFRKRQKVIQNPSLTKKKCKFKVLRHSN